jgi:hypothetical protein
MAGTFAGWLAWPDREVTTVVKVRPNLVLVGWTAAGGGLTNTYTVALARRIFTDLMAGGLYRRCVGVTQNGTALTSRASAALVDANASSWYWDEAAELLYVRTSTSADPDTFTVVHAQVEFYFSNDGRVINLTDGNADTGIPCRAWLPGDLPAVTREMEDFFFGQKFTAGTQVRVLNESFALYRLLAPDSDYWWKQTPVTIYLGGAYNGQTLNWSDYLTYLSMLVSDVACDDTQATLELVPIEQLTHAEIPPTPIFEGAYPNAGDGVRGSRLPIGYGRATMRPLLTDTTVSQGRWTVADPASQTLFAVHAVYAVAKTTGVKTLLTITTDYTQDLTACTVTITNASYAYTTHDLTVDVTGKPDGVGGALTTVGEIVRDLLQTFLGVATSEIDTAAFTQADTDAPEPLAVWLDSPRTVASVLSTSDTALPSVCGSTMATLTRTRAGLWTLRIWQPSYTLASLVSLRDADFSRFTPEPKLEAVYAGTRVFYGRNLATDAWSGVTETDTRTGYLAKTTDILERYTFLANASDATIYAQRMALFSGAQALEVEFALRTPKLAEALQGDKVAVTRTPAPTVAGAWTDHAMELIRLDLTPDLQIAGRLSDLRGFGNEIGQWKDTGAVAWASATTAERAIPGFWADASGFVDPADPTTQDISVWW